MKKFLKKIFSNFQESELSYILEKLYLEPWHIRTRSMFRILAYSEPEAY